MRCAPLVVLLVPLSASAKSAAKPKVIVLAPAQVVQHEPVHVTDEDAKQCALSNDGRGLPRHATTTSKKGDAEVVFDCGAIPAGAELFVHRGKKWYSTPVGVIVDVETMSHERTKLTLAHADFTPGGVGHGKTGVLLQLDLEETSLDAAKTQMPKKQKRLVVCTFEDQPRCGRIDITGNGVDETAWMSAKGISLGGELYTLQ